MLSFCNFSYSGGINHCLKEAAKGFVFVISMHLLLLRKQKHEENHINVQVKAHHATSDGKFPVEEPGVTVSFLFSFSPLFFSFFF